MRYSDHTFYHDIYDELSFVNKWLNCCISKYAMSDGERMAALRELYNRMMQEIEPKLTEKGLKKIKEPMSTKARHKIDNAYCIFNSRIVAVLAEKRRLLTVQRMLNIDQFRRTKKREQVCNRVANLLWQYAMAEREPALAHHWLQGLDEQLAMEQSVDETHDEARRRLEMTRRVGNRVEALYVAVKVYLEFMPEGTKATELSDNELLALDDEPFCETVATLLFNQVAVSSKWNRYEQTAQKEFAEMMWSHNGADR